MRRDSGPTESVATFGKAAGVVLAVATRVAAAVPPPRRKTPAPRGPRAAAGSPRRGLEAGGSPPATCSLGL